MLFIGHFETISTDKQFKFTHKKEVIAYAVYMILNNEIDGQYSICFAVSLSHNSISLGSPNV